MVVAARRCIGCTEHVVNMPQLGWIALWVSNPVSLSMYKLILSSLPTSKISQSTHPFCPPTLLVCKARLLPFIHAALCEVGKYYSVILSECRVCPANTVAGSPGQTVCPCMEGFYRAEGEEEFPCISESNHDTPHNLCMIFDQSQTRGSSDCSKSTHTLNLKFLPKVWILVA